MLLSEPPPSPGDLHFRLFGIPVRVHPFFWIMAVVLGLGGGEQGTPPGELLLWVAIVFASILVHELGHAFAQRRFGGHPWITLHGIGGLASCDDCDRSPWAQVLISLAGPAAGFLFAAAAVGLMRLTGHAVGVAPSHETPVGMVSTSLLGLRVYWQPLATYLANIAFHYILFVNIVWGLLNLLPVYPLDGGRVARELLSIRNPRRGIVLSLQLSIAAAAAMAIIGFVAWRDVYMLLMFGYLAYASLQTLQAYQGSRW